MVDPIGLSTDLLAILFSLWGLWVAGVMMAQIIKLLPLFLGLAGSLRWHRTYPKEAHDEFMRKLQIVPLEFLLLPIRYADKMIAEGDLIGLIAGLIAIPICMFVFVLGIWIGFWYVSLLRLLLRPFRVVYTLN
jgi:hypothetical protein